MTTTAVRDRTLVDGEYRVLSCAEENRRVALELLPIALDQIHEGLLFKSTGSGLHPCESWGEYLYKLTSNVHRGRGNFRCHIKNEHCAGFKPNHRSLRDLVEELRSVINDQNWSHSVVCQMLINGF